MVLGDYGHYHQPIFTTSSLPYPHCDTKRKEENNDDMEENKMLRIKKTDKMTIKEFKECNKAYEQVTLVLDKEKVDKHEEQYGLVKFKQSSNYRDAKGVVLNDDTVEFYPKAIVINDYAYVPYYFISEVEGVYHLEPSKR